MSPPSARSRAAIPRGKLGMSVAEHLRSMIFRAELKPGSRIDQDQLAADLDVSRLPVREAVQALELEGLVTIVPHRGAYVMPLSRQDILDQYDVYGLIVGLATERAASRLDEGGVRRLAELLERARHSSDDAEVESCNREFHRLINRTGSSARLLTVLRLLQRTVPVHFPEFDARWRCQSLADHEGILERLAVGDAEGARERMSAHLSFSGQWAVGVMEEAGFWSDQDADRPHATEGASP